MQKAQLVVGCLSLVSGLTGKCELPYHNPGFNRQFWKEVEYCQSIAQSNCRLGAHLLMGSEYFLGFGKIWMKGRESRTRRGVEKDFLIKRG